ncbi:holin [Erwinia phage FBB1]|nr:holin [Erwinia phage FBB1]
MAAGTPSVSITDLLFGVLDRIFKDDATGKVVLSRVLTVIVLFILVFIWYKGDSLMQMYKDSRFESYTEIIQKERESKFETSALEQLQIVQSSSGADFSAIYTFRPRNMNYFVDMVAYEGRLPSVVNPKNLGGFPIDKTSTEYSTHLTGEYFKTDKEFTYLPSKKKDEEIKYMFSCPYFNLDNVYSGSVSMYWYSGVPVVTDLRLAAICRQASRTLGRTK